MDEIIRFQENMLLIRRTVGWTAEEFGNRIGVTRQTINNLEKNNRDKFKLNKTQYIAMRSVLDAEIIQYPKDTNMLRILLDVLVDNPEKYKENEVKELIAKANLMTPSILAGTTSRAKVSKEWMKVAGSLAGVAAIIGLIPFTPAIVVGAVTGSWLSKIISTTKKGEK